MSSYVDSYSQTYTIADVGKVIDCFAADLDMIVQATGFWTREYARNTSDDIKLMAQHDYLKEVNICLIDPSSKTVRAAKYEVSTDAGLWTAQRPGNNLWPRISGSSLSVILRQSKAWPQSFADKLKCGWGDCNVDTSFSHLSRQHDRDYVSNAFGLRKSVFK